MWRCYDCGATGEPDGFLATTEALEQHFADTGHKHGVYSYGGQANDRTVIKVDRGEHTLVDAATWATNKHTVESLVRRRHTVIDVCQETPDTVSIISDFPTDWHPGQFSMLSAFTGEVPISFSGKVGGCTMQTIRKVGRVTSLLTSLQPGATITQRGPFGHGWRYQNAHDLLIITGGCGFAPLRPVIDDYTGPTTLLYGARTGADYLFAEDYACRARPRIGAWDALNLQLITDEEGFVSDLIKPEYIGPETVALICGPERMMKACGDKLVALGMSPKRIQVSMERRMLCGIGMCERCSCGRGRLVCKDGPVFEFAEPIEWEV